MCYKNKIETETELNIIDNYSIRKTRKTLRIYWGKEVEQTVKTTVMNIQRLNTGGNRWKQSRDNKIKTVKLKTDGTKTTKIKQEIKQGINKSLGHRGGRINRNSSNYIKTKPQPRREQNSNM